MICRVGALTPACASRPIDSFVAMPLSWIRAQVLRAPTIARIVAAAPPPRAHAPATPALQAPTALSALARTGAQTPASASRASACVARAIPGSTVASARALPTARGAVTATWSLASAPAGAHGAGLTARPASARATARARAMGDAWERPACANATADGSVTRAPSAPAPPIATVAPASMGPARAPRRVTAQRAS
jgi:hypothetical protein